MKSIYASKLYKTSKRQSNIRAALLDSNNCKLVQQLAQNLDEEYQTAELLTPQDKAEPSVNAEPSENSQAKKDTSAPKNKSLSSFPSSFSSGLDDEFDPATDLVEYPELDEGSADIDDTNDSPSEEDIEQATEIRACSNSTAISASDLESIKSSLNVVQYMSGVTRVYLKDNEVWIYYKDDINLNNVMTDVINYITQTYPSLEFNRLARSDNAIVFEIVQCSCHHLEEGVDIEDNT